MGTAAATLNRRDKLDALDRSRGGEEFYRDPDSGRYCKKCPAGKVVSNIDRTMCGLAVFLPAEPTCPCSSRGGSGCSSSPLLHWPET